MAAVDVNTYELLEVSTVGIPSNSDERPLLDHWIDTLHEGGSREKIVLHDGGLIRAVVISPERYAELRGVVQLKGKS